MPREGPANEDLFETELDKQGEYPQEFHSATRLREGTSLFERVRKALPNVPLERLRQPFITLIRNELLLGWDELDLMMRDMGKTDWVPDKGWWLYNGSFVEYLPTGRSKSWPGERNSAIFFNTGAHWSAHRLQQDSQDKADKLYSGMVRARPFRSTDAPLAGEQDGLATDASAQARHHLPIDDRAAFRMLDRPGASLPGHRARSQPTFGDATMVVRLDILPHLRSALGSRSRCSCATRSQSEGRSRSLPQHHRADRTTHRRSFPVRRSSSSPLD